MILFSLLVASSIPELRPFAREADGKLPDIRYFSFPENECPKLISSTTGWVAGAERTVEVFEVDDRFLLNIADGEYFISSNGASIGRAGLQPDSLSQLDREVLLGPVIVLALALRNVWSLHASAAMYNENVIAFLGESGMGKSTLAAYLSKQSGWQLVADDILPAEMSANQASLLPRFPQLKLPPDQQPGARLPERLPLKTLCVLQPAEPEQTPALQKLTAAQTVHALLGHIAGTRMFSAELLAAHLQFSTQAAAQVAAYKLAYPHRREALPLMKDLLEKIC